MEYPEGTVLLIRLFRFKYGITLAELSKETNLSAQLISQVELMQRTATMQLQKRLADALIEVLRQRRALTEAALADYSIMNGKLFEPVRPVIGGVHI